MDIQTIKRRSMAARESTLLVNGRSFTLRLPTTFELTLLAQRASLSKDEPAASFVLLRRALEQAVVGWDGVRVADLLPDSDDATPLAFDAEAVPLLLDAQPDVADALTAELASKIAARAARMDTAEKN